MILKRENVEIHTDDAKQIAELKVDGFVEVKVNDGKPKTKRAGKTAKADSE